MKVLKFWCAGALMAHRPSAMQYSKLSAHIMSVLLPTSLALKETQKMN